MMKKDLFRKIGRAGAGLLLGSALGIAALYPQVNQYKPNANAKKLIEIIKIDHTLVINMILYQRKMEIEGLGHVTVTYFDSKEIGKIGMGDSLTISTKGLWQESRFFNDCNINGISSDEARAHYDRAIMPKKDFDKYDNGLLTYNKKIENVLRFYNDSYNETLLTIIKFLESSK